MPRHRDYSFTEMRDMVCVYAQEEFCGRAAARRYMEFYPNRRQPNHKLFQNLYDRMGETGSFRPKRVSGRPKVVTVDQEEEVLVR
jgi:predicted metalloprotease